jgi:hypothetical protein
MPHESDFKLVSKRKRLREVLNVARSAGLLSRHQGIHEASAGAVESHPPELW